ncbi:PEGA domain-containing protein [Pyxidicoccus xibeiensis]|uniref:PEGA domain-containing protein n=1 Tax=Pyxidicoccus xibeiensis TaxID=2906759 RepID=UPI00225E4F5B|nr:PEGA domain-containing protein [Pyxidicoccus xibeiensis]
MTRGLRPLLFLALALLVTGTSAHAADNRAAARKQFERGTRLYQQARYEEAVSAFEEAYRLRPNGVVHYNLGQCHEKLGNLEKALESYRAYLRDVPQAEDRDTVERLIASLEARAEARRKPQVNIASEPSGAELRLDGTAVGATPWSGPVEAGTHQLELTHPGHAPLRRELEVRSGEPVQLQLALTPEMALTGEVKEQPRPRGRTWTWVAAGAAGVAAAGAVTLGLMARKDSRELVGSRHEQPEAQRLHDSAVSKSRTANVLYAVAGVAGAAGVTLFFVEGSF